MLNPNSMSGNDKMPPEVQRWIGWQLFERVPANIIVIDRSYEVIAANSRWVETFGDAVGKHCYEAYRQSDTPCKNCSAEATFRDGTVQITDKTGIDKGGRPAHYVVHRAPVFNVIGEVAYVIEMSYDVTETTDLRRRFDLLFERVPCYVAVIDRDLQIVRFNQLAQRTFGDPDGRPCYEVFKGRDSRCHDCPTRKTLKDGTSHSAKQRGLDKNGNPRSYQVSTAPLSEGDGKVEHVIEMCMDVTETEDLSEELARQGRLSTLITDSALDALVAGDASGRITVFNPAAERLFGLAAEQVVGRRTIKEILPAEIVDATRENEQNLHQPETTIVDRSGREIPVRISATCLRNEDHEIGISVFLHDRTEHKRIEQENIDNARFAAVGQTVSQLAHGIKNILTGLQGGMYRVKTGMKQGSTERVEKGWNALERNVDRITELVKGFLSLSKGHLPDVQPTDPCSIATDVFELFKDSAEESGVHLELQAPSELPPANLDAEDMRICVENLVSNAMDACHVADNDELTVTIRVSERDGVIRYEVVDTGCGMDYEVKRKVFTTFFSTKGLGGTGLGLLLTRKIVHEHGGRIDVESTPGKGSAFRIDLPRERLPTLSVEDADSEPTDGEEEPQ
ncbi:MAG: PAS domain-containing protein [Thermoanaerobaculales bacterium]|jgi:PAS domain S-box-containing protein|nr:PAS domain-containing protein [Thermoanaerobaculales bacterium]